MLPDDIKALNKLPPLTSDNASQGSIALLTSQISKVADLSAHTDELKCRTTLIAKLETKLKEDSCTPIQLHPLLVARLVRDGWEKVMRIPLYNFDEITGTKDTPFKDTFDMRERLDLNMAGVYQIQFGMSISSPDHLIEALSTEQCDITVE